MTTDLMEVYSLEEGDQIISNGNVYRIVGIHDGDSFEYRLDVIDEEGYLKSLECDGDHKVRLVCDTDHEAVV